MIGWQIGKKIAIHAIDKSGKINSISYEELLKTVINFTFFLSIIGRTV